MTATDLMLYRLRAPTDRSIRDRAGRVVAAGGRTSPLAAGAFTLAPGRRWSSPASGASYPVEWRIGVPGGAAGALGRAAARLSGDVRRPAVGDCVLGRRGRHQRHARRASRDRQGVSRDDGIQRPRDGRVARPRAHRSAGRLSLAAAPTPPAGTLRRARGTRRCARSSPGATARPCRTGGRGARWLR